MLHERGKIDFEDLNLKKEIEHAKKKGVGRHNPGYCNSKLMNVYFARALAHKLKNSGIDVNDCCPGFTATGLFRYYSFTLLDIIFFYYCVYYILPVYRHSIRWYHYFVMAPVMLFFMKTAKQVSIALINLKDQYISALFLPSETCSLFLIDFVPKVYRYMYKYKTAVKCIFSSFVIEWIYIHELTLKTVYRPVLTAYNFRLPISYITKTFITVDHVVSNIVFSASYF